MKMPLIKLNFFILVLFLSTTALAKGSSSNGTGFFRRDFGLGASGNTSFFDETQSTTFYKHTGLALAIEMDLRFGFRSDLLSLGVTGAYGFNWYDVNRYNDPSTNSYYHNDMSQALAGGFLAYKLGGGATGPEIMMEYYDYAKQTVRYSDGKSQNPYKKGDWISGKGWGFGFGGLHNDTYGWILYRYIEFTKQSISGVETELPTTNKGAPHQQSLVILIGQSF